MLSIGEMNNKLSLCVQAQFQGMNKTKTKGGGDEH